MVEPRGIRLACVLAHPDDESLGMGGTLARYAAEGVEIHVVTATRGQAGRYKDNTNHPGPEALGRIREAELRAAAKELGVQDVRFQALDSRIPSQAARRGVADDFGDELSDVVVVDHAAAPGDDGCAARGEPTTNLVELVRALCGECFVPRIGTIRRPH